MKTRLLAGMLCWMLVSLMLTVACSQPTPPPKPPAAAPSVSPTAAPAPTPAAKPAPAPTPVAKPPFYGGKTITMFVTIAVGGIADIQARTFAPMLSKYIPGNPLFTFDNRGAGGGAAAALYYLDRAKPDGLSLLQITGALFTRWHTRATGHDYDLRPTTMLYAGQSDRVIYVSGKLGVRNVKELLALGRPIKSSHMTPESGLSIAERLTAELLGFKTQQTMGYSTATEMHLAVLRGESEMTVQQAGPNWIAIQGEVAKGTIVPLYQDGILRGKEIVRSPAMPDIPTVVEVYKEIYGKAPAGAAFDNQFQFLSDFLAQPILVHSNAPAEAFQALRAGFKNMIASPDFKKWSLQQQGTEDTEKMYLQGDQAEEVWRTMLSRGQK